MNGFDGEEGTGQEKCRCLYSRQTTQTKSTIYSRYLLSVGLGNGENAPSLWHSKTRLLVLAPSDVIPIQDQSNATSFLHPLSSNQAARESTTWLRRTAHVRLTTIAIRTSNQTESQFLHLPEPEISRLCMLGVHNFPAASTCMLGSHSISSHPSRYTVTYKTIFTANQSRSMLSKKPSWTVLYLPSMTSHYLGDLTLFHLFTMDRMCEGGVWRIGLR